MGESFIKLHRKFMNWEWYDNANVKILFIHLLLTAQYEPFRYRGEEYPAGSLITGRKKLANELGMTEQQIRYSLNKLKLTNEITIKSHNQYSIISIKNWWRYQSNPQQNNQRITNEQPTNNQRITTIQEIKKERNKEEKNCINSEKTQKKIDPFSNPLIRYFKDEYFKVFNNKPYLTAIERNKIVELCADIDDFKGTIPIVFQKLKNIDFGFENWKPTANWLLKDSNYTAVLNGTYDKQRKKTVWEELKERHNGTT